MVEKVFLVPWNMLDVCFEKCGKIIVAQVIVDDILLTMPCLEEKCPYEAKRMYVGKHKIMGKTYETYLRKVQGP